MGVSDKGEHINPYAGELSQKPDRRRVRRQVARPPHHAFDAESERPPCQPGEQENKKAISQRAGGFCRIEHVVRDRQKFIRQVVHVCTLPGCDSEQYTRTWTSLKSGGQSLPSGHDEFQANEQAKNEEED